jgi:tetratricopeptide (TPR) repeat protein
VGNVHWRQNELDAAEDQFREYLEISEGLAAREPETPEWRLEVAYGLSNMGLIQEVRGKLEDARQAYERSLEIRRALVKREPRNAELLADLGSAHSKLASVLDRKGDLHRALDHFQADLEIKRGLAAVHPEDASLRQALGISENLVGSSLADLGDLAEARRRFGGAVEIFTELATRDPTNSRWRRELAINLFRLGGVHQALGEHAEALDHLGEAHRLVSVLVTQDPTDLRWRQDLATVQLGLAEARAEAPGALDAALGEVRSAVATLDELARASSDDRVLVRRLAGAHLTLGRLLERSGHDREAWASWSRGLEVVEAASGAPDRWLLEQRARALLLMGDLESAQPLAQQLDDIGLRDPGFWALARERGLIHLGPLGGAGNSSPRPRKEGTLP